MRPACCARPVAMAISRSRRCRGCDFQSRIIAARSSRVARRRSSTVAAVAQTWLTSASVKSRSLSQSHKPSVLLLSFLAVSMERTRSAATPDSKSPSWYVTSYVIASPSTLTAATVPTYQFGPPSHRASTDAPTVSGAWGSSGTVSLAFFSGGSAASSGAGAASALSSSSSSSSASSSAGGGSNGASISRSRLWPLTVSGAGSTSSVFSMAGLRGAASRARTGRIDTPDARSSPSFRDNT
mmetsp:Transcript_13222/g.44193  ORF Transcript_13222/g.44193 Transcript_13222/m.44193 type:complete len:240 (-) Transcript_13222:27-746(-)